MFLVFIQQEFVIFFLITQPLVCKINQHNQSLLHTFSCLFNGQFEIIELRKSIYHFRSLLRHKHNNPATNAVIPPAEVCDCC